MSFAKLIGNERNKAVLQRLLLGGRIGATLIFAGPDGIGKRQFALAMAKALNCHQPVIDAAQGRYDSCDTCPVCQRINAGVYGDVTTIKPDGQFIKIVQTRQIAHEVQYRPREGKQRFFLIDDADRLRDEAANSLLKTLEEPPPTSTLILLTAKPHALLQTIRSRAQRINFAPLTTAEMEEYLTANFRRPKPDTLLLARLTEGRIGQATAFDLGVYRQERNVLINLLELLATGENRFRLMKAAEYLGKKEREEFERELDLLNRLLRDLFLLAAGSARDTIVNIDVADKLEPLAAATGIPKLTNWAEQFNELRARLRFNVNRQLATEALLLNLIGVSQA
ncbi:MAG: DNA polymerase III subunit delta' [Acidobacteria bacterium]|nr:DNA polymerase III subunit delta' [Acidobacteriota bacterium]MBI3422936.1 DNA polymerase III subunit delta' [Acidobacteriota bacterium]